MVESHKKLKGITRLMFVDLDKVRMDIGGKLESLSFLN